jgi:hypothetical protein
VKSETAQISEHNSGNRQPEQHDAADCEPDYSQANESDSGSFSHGLNIVVIAQSVANSDSAH